MESSVPIHSQKTETIFNWQVSSLHRKNPRNEDRWKHFASVTFKCLQKSAWLGFPICDLGHCLRPQEIVFFLKNENSENFLTPSGCLGIFHLRFCVLLSSESPL